MTANSPKGGTSTQPKGKAITLAANQQPTLKPLNAQEQRFADDYLIHLDAYRAGIHAGYSESMSKTKCYQWVSNGKAKPHIYAYVQQKRSEISVEAGVTAEMVLSRLWNIATADPNELMTHRRVCCRHCWGDDHQYQWVNRNEWAKAVAVAKDENRSPPTMEGGFDFDKTERPHPKCPHCKGEGYGDTIFKDTSNLSEAGKTLYAGVKKTKDGYEVKTHDQLAALTSVARHLGMFNDKLTLKGDEESPVVALIKRVSGRTIGPAGDA